MASVRSKFVAVMQDALDSGRVISLYHQSHDADRFEVGFVDAVSAHEVVLLCLTPKGEEDGRMVVRIDDIVALEVDDPYSQKIQTLYNYRGSVFNREDSNKSTTLGIPNLDEQLERAKENNSVVSIEDANGTRFTGFITDVSDSTIEIGLLSQFGSPDGTVYLAREMVGKIDIGRRDEQTRAFLYKINHELKRLLEP